MFHPKCPTPRGGLPTVTAEERKPVLCRGRRGRLVGGIAPCPRRAWARCALVGGAGRGAGGPHHSRFAALAGGSERPTHGRFQGATPPSLSLSSDSAGAALAAAATAAGIPRLMSAVPGGFAYCTSDRLTADTLREAASTAHPPARNAELAVAAVEARPAAGPEERVQIHVRQVPAVDGTRGTRELRERRARGDNRRGRKRRCLHRLAIVRQHPMSYPPTSAPFHTRSLLSRSPHFLSVYFFFGTYKWTTES